MAARTVRLKTAVKPHKYQFNLRILSCEPIARDKSWPDEEPSPARNRKIIGDGILAAIPDAHQKHPSITKGKKEK